MSFIHASIPMTANKINNMLQKGEINLDHIIQRPVVWKKEKMSTLIDTMLNDMYIPNIIAKKVEIKNGDNIKKIYYILDGKQRISTFTSFINNEWRLQLDNPVIEYECDGEIVEDNIGGCLFSELPERCRNKIKNTQFNIVYFDNITENEARTMFKRLNEGVPLTCKNKQIAVCPDIQLLLEIAKHELFSEMFSEKSRSAKNECIVIMKMLEMLNLDIREVTFSGKKFENFIASTEITDEMIGLLNSMFDYIHDMHSILIEKDKDTTAKRIYTETHFVSLVPYIKKALENEVATATFAEKINLFFNTNNEYFDNYNEYCQSGSASTRCITGRDGALNQWYYDTFEKDAKVSDEPTTEEPAAEESAADEVTEVALN